MKLLGQDALTRAQSLVGSNYDGGRPDDDFYPTPPPATKAFILYSEKCGFLDYEFDEIWECACGDGAMSQVFIDAGYDIISSDLYNHGYGDVGIDFLKQNKENFFPTKYDNRINSIVTNPPFKFAEQFARKALEFEQVTKVALLCKLSFLESLSRKNLFQNTPLYKVLVFSNRITLTRNGNKMKNSGMIAYAWFLWDKTYKNSPTIDWISTKE